MTLGIGRGPNRLFVALTVAWAVYCAVLYPMQRQWEGRARVLVQYRDENKNCDHLVQESPGWPMTKDCYQRALENRQSGFEFYSLGDFWRLDIAFWKLLIPVIVLPPVIIYAVALVGRWIWEGFNAR